MWIKINGRLINLNNIIAINTNIESIGDYGYKKYKLIFRTTRDEEYLGFCYDCEEDMRNVYKKVQSIIDCKEI